MKILFVSSSLALLFLVQPIMAQQESNRILIQEYIKQSERQKKTGLIMLGTGVGAVVIGTVLFATAWNSGSEFAGGASLLFLTAGSISTVARIPILISSASNGRKAGKLSIGIGQTQALQAPGISARAYPTVGFSFPLNAQKP